MYLPRSPCRARASIDTYLGMENMCFHAPVNSIVPAWYSLKAPKPSQAKTTLPNLGWGDKVSDYM